MQIQRIKDVAKFYNGYAFKSKNYTDAGDYIVRIGDIKQKGIDLSNAKRVDVIKEKKDLSNFQIKQNSILIAMSGATTGKVSLYNLNQLAYLNQRVGMLVCENNILPKYLYYFLSNYSEKFLTSAIGAAVQNLSKFQIENTKIPVPSLQKQEKIVEKLDKVFENIELKFNVYKNKIELNKQMCKSKLNQIFNDELYKSGGIKLNDFVDLQKGKKPEISQQRKRNLPYLTAKYIRGESEPEYGIPDSKGIVLVNPKDYVIIMDGSNSGEVFTGINGILASTMGKIVLKQKINIKYLGYFLDFNKENFANTKTGSAIPHLSKEVFFNLRIPDITLKEQEKIVDKLDKFFINIDTNLKIIDKEKFLLNNLKKSILNKEFSYE